jgi:protein tyrosine/serine phosphatase
MTSTHLELEGIGNFREVAAYPLQGGKRIKPGMLYRSGAPDGMTEADAARLADHFRIACVLDVRHPDEIGAMGVAHGLAHCVINLSLFPEDSSQQDLIAELNGLYGTGPSPERYLHYLSVGSEKVVEAFRILAEPSTYPVLIHCTAGKDRTGVIVGMLMDILGAQDEDIAHEYELSNAGLERLIEYLRTSGRVLEGTDDEIRARLATPAAHMAGFIRLLRERHGGAEAFLTERGFPRASVAHIREMLTA